MLPASVLFGPAALSRPSKLRRLRQWSIASQPCHETCGWRVFATSLSASHPANLLSSRGDKHHLCQSCQQPPAFARRVQKSKPNKKPPAPKWPWVITLRLHFGADEHPWITYFDVHQGYSFLTHSQMDPDSKRKPLSAQLLDFLLAVSIAWDLSRRTSMRSSKGERPGQTF